MTFLSTHLPFPAAPEIAGAYATALPPPGSHLVISDTLTSPGHFALYHLFSAAVTRKQRVLWVDLRTEGRASLEAVLRKMSVTLPSANSGSFVHIQPNSLPAGLGAPNSPGLFDENDQPTLEPLFEAVKVQVSEKPPALVVLDGLSELLSIGFTSVQVGQLVRAIQRQTQSSGSTLVSTIHADSLGAKALPTHQLLERLLRIADGWWRIEGLASGRSGDVHGEISSHALGSADGWPVVSKAQPLQYRLEASTVKVFPKGTGRGYL